MPSLWLPRANVSTNKSTNRWRIFVFSTTLLWRCMAETTGEAWNVQKKWLPTAPMWWRLHLDGCCRILTYTKSTFRAWNISFWTRQTRILDMGFFDDIMKIEKTTAQRPPNHYVFSHHPALKHAIARPPDTILQVYIFASEPQKVEIVRSLFKEKAEQSDFVFVLSWKWKR